MDGCGSWFILNLLHPQLGGGGGEGEGQGRAGEVQITLSYIIAADEEATRIK